MKINQDLKEVICGFCVHLVWRRTMILMLPLFLQ